MSNQTFRPFNATAREDAKIDLAELGGAHELAHEIRQRPRQLADSTLAMLIRWEAEDAHAKRAAEMSHAIRKSRKPAA
jgi:hypothetical protein